MHQLQLIGIKTNLESFVTTTLMEHMLNRHQLHLFLWVSKQWGNLWAGYTEVLNWYFPLTTSQVYAVCLTKHTKNISSGHNWEPARIEEWNNSYARIHPDGDLGYSVIAICKAQQQWGTNRTNGIYSFPIPFTEALCCFGGGEAGSGYYDNASAYSNTQVRVYSDGSSRFVSWIAIGA